MPARPYELQFGDRLRAVREQRGLSQEALAHAAGLHPTAISLIERGRRSAKVKTVAQLARALRVQPAELMPEIALGRR